MEIVLVVVFAAYVVMIIGSFIWVVATKDDSKKNIKKVSIFLANLLFWGSVVFLVALAIFNY